MDQKVDWKDTVMHVEMSGLWFSQRSQFKITAVDEWVPWRARREIDIAAVVLLGWPLLYLTVCLMTFTEWFIYLLIITTQQKDQRPLTLSVKAQEAKNTCNTQSTKHREIDKKNRNQTLHIKPHEKKRICLTHLSRMAFFLVVGRHTHS